MLFLSFPPSLVASWAVLGLFSPAVAAIVEAAADDVEVAVFTNTVTVTITSTSTSYPSTCPLGASSLPLSNILLNSSIATTTNEIVSTNSTLMPYAPTASVVLPSLFQSNLTNTMATITALNVSTSPTMLTTSSSYGLNTTSAIAPQSVQQNSTMLVLPSSTTDDVVPTTSSEQPSSSPLSTTSMPTSTSTPLLATSADPTSSSTSIEITTALTTSLDTDTSSTSSSTSCSPSADTTAAPVTLDLPTITTSSAEATMTSAESSSASDDTTTAPTTILDISTPITDSVEATATSTDSSSTSVDFTTAVPTPLDPTTSTTSSVETTSSSTITDITTASVTSIDTTSSTTSTTAVPIPTVTNLVVNGGFETSSTSYSPWTLPANYPLVTYSINDTITAHGGSNALQIQYNLHVAGYMSYITQTLSTTAGSTYDFSMWVMSDKSMYNIVCDFWAHDAANTVIAFMAINSATTSSTWKQLTGTYTAKSGSTVLYLRTECFNQVLGARNIFIDDVAMTLAS